MNEWLDLLHGFHEGDQSVQRSSVGERSLQSKSEAFIWNFSVNTFSVKWWVATRRRVTYDISAWENANTEPSTRFCAIGPATAPIKNKAVLSTFARMFKYDTNKTWKKLTTAGTPFWANARSAATKSRINPLLMLSTKISYSHWSSLTDDWTAKSTFRLAREFKMAPSASNCFPL